MLNPWKLLVAALFVGLSVVLSACDELSEEGDGGLGFGTGGTTTVAITMKLSHFNKPVVIEAPEVKPTATPAPTATPTPTPTSTPTPVPPEASFSVDQESGSAPLVVQFQNTSNGPVTTLEWDFGDGTASADQSPSHRYTIAGSYTVTLKPESTEGRPLGQPLKKPAGAPLNLG